MSKNESCPDILSNNKKCNFVTDILKIDNDILMNSCRTQYWEEFQTEQQQQF